MKKLFELQYALNIQLFSEEISEQQKNGEEKNGLENKDVDNNNDDNVSMSKKQLSERLNRERNKAKEEFEKEMSEKFKDMFTKALEEQEKKRKEEENFAKLNEKEKQEELARREREDIEKQKKEIEKQRREIQIVKYTDEIMTAYDNDKLPSRDKFRPIANLLAKASEQEKIDCYNAFKDIIKDVETTAFQESLKQNPPKDSGSNKTTFASDRFIKMQKEDSQNKSLDDWGNQQF